MNSTSTGSSLKRFFLWFIVGICLMAAGVAAVILLIALAPKPRQVEAVVIVPEVNTLILEHRDRPLTVEGSGLVTARAEITLSSQVSGEVTSIHPELVTGGFISQGDVMVSIDPRPYQAALNEAIAARQALAANLDYLEKQLTRLQALRGGNFVSDDNLDDVISRRDQAIANLARQDALILRNELDLEHTRIRAPFSGYVQSESVDIGDIVAPGRELGRFYASDGAEILVSLNIEDAGFIPSLWQRQAELSRPAVVRASYGNQRYEWPAELVRVEADLDRSTRTIDVVVSVADPSQRGTPVQGHAAPVTVSAPPLLVGMYADVSIEGIRVPGHFTLPVKAVHDSNIWTVDSENRLHINPVEIVRQEGNSFVLLAPQLPEGTRIITSNIALVSDGMAVSVAELAQ